MGWSVVYEIASFICKSTNFLYIIYIRRIYFCYLIIGIPIVTLYSYSHFSQKKSVFLYYCKTNKFLLRKSLPKKNSQSFRIAINYSKIKTVGFFVLYGHAVSGRFVASVGPLVIEKFYLSRKSSISYDQNCFQTTLVHIFCNVLDCLFKKKIYIYVFIYL